MFPFPTPKRFMKDRDAFNIKWILGAYNLFQVIVCVYLVHKVRTPSSPNSTTSSPSAIVHFHPDPNHRNPHARHLAMHTRRSGSAQPEIPRQSRHHVHDISAENHRTRWDRVLCAAPQDQPNLGAARLPSCQHGAVGLVDVEVRGGRHDYVHDLAEPVRAHDHVRLLFCGAVRAAGATLADRCEATADNVSNGQLMCWIVSCVLGYYKYSVTVCRYNSAWWSRTAAWDCTTTAKCRAGWCTFSFRTWCTYSTCSIDSSSGRIVTTNANRRVTDRHEYE